MKRILIIEDEPFNAERLTMLLKKYDKTFIVDEPLRNTDEIRNALAIKNDYDLIISDIRLQDADVFDVFKELDICAPVIFTTAYEEYAIEAFRHNGVDYLLKPIDYKDLAKALDKVCQLYFSNSETDSIIQEDTLHKYRQRFLINKGDELIPINVEDILYFKRENRSCLVCMNDGKHFYINISINELENILNPDLFFKINRQYIISLNSIKNIRTYVNSKLIVELWHCDDEVLVISRDRALTFKNWIER